MSSSKGMREALHEWKRLFERPLNAANEFAEGTPIQTTRGLERLIKARGITVRWESRLPVACHGFSMKIDGRFFIVVKPGSAQAEFYSLSHELGHILLHDAGCTSAETHTGQELEAHVFAIALLFRSGGFRDGLEINRDARTIASGLTLVTLTLFLFWGATHLWEWLRKT